MFRSNSYKLEFIRYYAQAKLILQELLEANNAANQEEFELALSGAFDSIIELAAWLAERLEMTEDLAAAFPEIYMIDE